MKPTVTLIQDHLLDNMREELKKELSKRFKKGDKVCVKLHFGEPGNLNYIRPSIAGAVIEVLKSIGTKPFIFESLVAYAGPRSEVKSHLEVARKHGFTKETVGCPIVISDKGKTVKSEYYKDFEVCKDLVEADGLLVLSHFKDHPSASWGGAIKNLGMGAVPIKSKRLMHFSVKARAAHIEKCTGCGLCVKACVKAESGAIKLVDGKPVIGKCWACGTCVLACPNGVLEMTGLPLGAGLAEATKQVLAHFDKKKRFYVNVLLDISAHCDCFSETSINAAAPNIGITLSDDPLAIDVASLDLVNKATGDKFDKLW